MKRTFVELSGLGLLTMFLLGCGNGNSNGGSALPGDTSGGQTLNFGGLITRIAGTAQPPVTSGGAGTVVTGVAGGLVSSLLYARANTTLAETRIAFQSFRDGNYEIYTMNTDGTGQMRLTNNSADDAIPSWSPDGSKIVFYSNRDGNNEIYVMNADGTGQTRLTNNGFTDGDPSWSPDGSKIAFTSNRDGNFEIYTMNLDGSAQTRITNIAGNDVYPSWSPNGSRILFHSSRDGNVEIYTMNPDGTGQTRLTNNSATDADPSWSPDGTKIAFESLRDGNSEIYVMNANGTGQTRLTNQAAEDASAWWSPDGSRIIFHTIRDSNFEIYSMNPNGSGQTRLTTNTDIDIWAHWSPLQSKRELIGDRGQLGAAAAGFLYGQSGNAITSVVTFDTPDASRINARITTQTGITPGLSNYIFTITSSDTLTKLTYINSYYDGPKIVVGVGGITASPSGAIVSFNSTGQVSSVLPYIANRASGAPSASVENGAQVLRGKFLGVWDEAGKNRALGGATEVKIDVTTGKLLLVK